MKAYVRKYIKNKSIFDKDGKYLKDGSKDAPVDLGIDIFRKLMKECVIWL